MRLTMLITTGIGSRKMAIGKTKMEANTSGLYTSLGTGLDVQKLQSQVFLNDQMTLNLWRMKSLQCWQVMVYRQETNPDPANSMRGFPRASVFKGETRGDAPSSPSPYTLSPKG